VSATPRSARKYDDWGADWSHGIAGMRCVGYTRGSQQASLAGVVLGFETSVLATSAISFRNFFRRHGGGRIYLAAARNLRGFSWASIAKISLRGTGLASGKLHHARGSDARAKRRLDFYRRKRSMSGDVCGGAEWSYKLREEKQGQWRA